VDVGSSSYTLDCEGRVDATALRVAVVRGRFEVAEARLSAGPSMDHRDPRGRTALALFWGRADSVRWLVDHGASE
jgi:ankyrin repeat protein